MKIKTEVKAIPGQRVMVLNYRKRPHEWEEGEVRSTNIGVTNNGKIRNSYNVATIRQTRTKRQPWGRCIFLSVGDDGITLI